MDKTANLFIYELYQRMSSDSDSPYAHMNIEQLYQKCHFLFEFYEDNYRNLLPLRKDIKVLDIGFGLGIFMMYLKKNSYRNIYGVEYNKIQVDHLREMEFHTEQISDLSQYLQKNRCQFDLIHASNVVEHFPKYTLIETFDLLYGSLRDNGELIAVVPNIASYRGVYNRYLVLGHEVGFTEVSLKQLFQVTNFKDIKILSSRIRFRPRIKNILMIILQKIFYFIIGFFDYVYLGVNKPHHLGLYLLGIGRKV